MALQVWLPGTNGTLLNQGLYKLPNPSYNSMSEFTLGKLGKAIKGNAMYHLSSDIFGDKWSVACWIKFISGYSQYNNIILCLNTSGSEDSKFYLSIVNNTYLNIGRGGSSGVTYTLSGGFIIDTWYHVAATCDGTKTSLYLNGNLVNSGNVGSVKSALNLGIGCRSTNDAGTNITGFSWPMNDIRIYDHCLSPKEVKEISKGLVLHYKLDDIYSESTTNIASSLNPQSNVGGWGRITSTKIDTNYYHIKHYYGSSSNPSYWSTFVYTLPSSYANKIITFSARLKNINYHDINNMTSWIFFGQGNNGTYPTHGSVTYYINQLYENIQLVWTGTLNNTNNYLVFEIWSNDLNTNGTIELDLYDIQIEEKDHATPYVNGTRIATTIYDCSGYLNNGTIFGNLTVNNDSPRYNNCTKNLSEYLLNSIFDFPESKGITFACWVNLTTWGSQTSGIWATSTNSITTPTDYNTTTCNHRDSGFDIRGTNGTTYRLTCNNTDIPLNTWKYIVMTHDGINAKLYINGTLIRTISVPTSLVGFKSLFIGWSNAGGLNRRCQGSWSDFRIYATALSDMDILELYNTPANIDNFGNMFSMEFDEDYSTERELSPVPTSGFTVTNDGYKVSGHTWPSADYIPISPSGKTYYYDIEYSNVAGNLLYIGFEKYDINKASGSNNECQYIVNTTSVANHVRVTGTINLSTANGNTAAFTKLRILNDWNNTGNSTYIGTIHYISLKEVTSIKESKIEKTGQMIGNTFIESKNASISKTGNIIGNQFMEK